MLNKSIKFLIENKLIALFVAWAVVNAPFEWNPATIGAIPDIGKNQQIVFTKWDGRSPQDIKTKSSIL